MGKSIISEERRCYMCGSVRWIEHHHVFGAAYKKKSDKYGLIVPLCRWCHNEPPNGVHHNAENMRILREKAQKIAMKKYGWSIEDFIRIFGKNYIEEEEDEGIITM